MITTKVVFKRRINKMRKFQSSSITINNINLTGDFDAKIYAINGISESYFARLNNKNEVNLFDEDGDSISVDKLASLKNYLNTINDVVMSGESAVVTYAVGLAPDKDSANKLRNFPKDTFVKNVGILNFMEIKKYASGMTNRIDVSVNLKAEPVNGSGVVTLIGAGGDVTEKPLNLRSNYRGQSLVQNTIESNRSFLEQTAIDLYNEL